MRAPNFFLSGTLPRPSGLLLGLRAPPSLTILIPTSKTSKMITRRVYLLPIFFTQLIQHLYNNGSDPRSEPGPAGANESLGRLAASEANFSAADKEPTTLWTAHILCNDFEVGSSFSVFIFMGKESEISGDSGQWSSSPNLVGCNNVLANSEPEHCANCMENADQQVEGYVQLNGALENSVQSLKEDTVKPYLRENLQWRVAKADGTVINPTSLKIVVVATPILETGDDMFPVLGESRQLHECTEGRC